MSEGTLDFAALVPAGSPPPAVRWTGFAKYHFIGGNNDGDQVPVEGLKAAATPCCDARGTLGNYGLGRPAGLPAPARVPGRQAQARRRHRLRRRRHPDHLGLAAGTRPGQRTLLARGDTVVCEQMTYGGALTRFRTGRDCRRRSVDHDGLSMVGLEATLKTQGARHRPKYIYTIPTVQNPTATVMSEARRHELLRLAEGMACRSSRTTATPT